MTRKASKAKRKPVAGNPKDNNKPAPTVCLKAAPVKAKMRPDKAAVALTPKQEQFCFKYLELGDASSAYRDAYSCEKMKPESIHRNAHELLKDTKISSRIEELRKDHREQHDITVARLTAELLPIAFADAGDFFEWGPHGVKVKDSATLSRTQRSAVSEVSQTITQGGGTIKIKLHDKLVAIDKLARLHGLIIEKREHSGEIALSLATRLEAAQRRLEADETRTIELKPEAAE